MQQHSRTDTAVVYVKSEGKLGVSRTWIAWLAVASQLQLPTPVHNVLPLGDRLDVVKPATH